MKNLPTFDESYLIYHDDDHSKSESRVLLDKITHIEGSETGAGSAYSLVYVEGGKWVKVYGKTHEIADVLSNALDKRKNKSFFGRIFNTK
jgi:hypothetical protein